MLGYRDKTVEFEDPEKIIADITSIINEVNPSLIITFYPGYAVCRLTTMQLEPLWYKQWNESLQMNVQLFIFLAFSNGCEQEIGQADILHDVTEFAPKKIACLLSHQSQVQLFAGFRREICNLVTLT